MRLPMLTLSVAAAIVATSVFAVQRLSEVHMDRPDFPQTEWLQTEVDKHGSRTLSVLYVGNSHTYVNNIPGMVRQDLEERLDDERIVVHAVIAIGGANLIDYVGQPEVERVLNAIPWDFVLLQGRGAMPLIEDFRSNFQKAVSWFRKNTKHRDTKIVLYETWPYRAGHENYSTIDIQEDDAREPIGMGRLIRREYRKAARRIDATIAPVGTCWMQSPDRQAFYSADGNHASEAGSRLAAEIIAKVISKSLDSPGRTLEPTRLCEAVLADR